MTTRSSKRTTKTAVRRTAVLFAFVRPNHGIYLYRGPKDATRFADAFRRYDRSGDLRVFPSDRWQRVFSFCASGFRKGTGLSIPVGYKVFRIRVSIKAGTGR